VSWSNYLDSFLKMECLTPNSPWFSGFAWAHGVGPRSTSEHGPTRRSNT
jgi:hypothetical protein